MCLNNFRFKEIIMTKTILFMCILIVSSVCSFSRNLDSYPHEERLRPQVLPPGMWQVATPGFGLSINGDMDGLLMYSDGPTFFPRIGLKNGWEMSAFPFPYFTKRISNTDIIDSLGQSTFLPSVVLRGGLTLSSGKIELGIKKVISKRSWYEGSTNIDIPIRFDKKQKLKLSSISGHIQNGLGVQLTNKMNLFVAEDLGLHCLFDSNKIDGYGVTARLPITLQGNFAKWFTVKLKAVPTIGHNYGWVDCFGGMIFQW
jgi:hypothetical protein